MSGKQDYVQHLEYVVRWLRNAGFQVMSVDAETGVITLKVRGAPNEDSHD